MLVIFQYFIQYISFKDRLDFDTKLENSNFTNVIVKEHCLMHVYHLALGVSVLYFFFSSFNLTQQQ